MQLNKTEYSRRYDLIVPVIAAASLLASCALGSFRKYFWYDELLTFYLVNDSSLCSMLTALGDQVDTSPPLYYVLAWVWVKLSGTSELSLRLFSSACVCSSFFIVWSVLRRRYGLWPASIACTACYGLSSNILYQNAEARCYGLFLVIGALCIMQYDMSNTRPKSSCRDFLLNALAHSAMVYTHLYGFLYSGVFLVAAILRDLLHKKFRMKYYLSIVVGWMSFIAWFRPFLRQADTGSPKFWLREPSLRGLIVSFDSGIQLGLLIALLFMAFLAVSFLGRETAKSYESSSWFGRNKTDYHDTALMILGVCLVFVAPFVSWVFSRIFTPIFHTRYLILSSLGWVIIICIITVNSLGHKTSLSNFKQKLVLSALVSFFLAAALGYPFTGGRWHDRPAPIKTDCHGNLPIAIESAITYLPLSHYSSMRDQYYFILDWEAAMDEKSSAVAVTDYKIMKALRRHYSFHNVLDSKAFLEENQRFLVNNHPGRMWFETKIKSNPKYSWRKLRSGIILVEKAE